MGKSHWMVRSTLLLAVACLAYGCGGGGGGDGLGGSQTVAAAVAGGGPASEPLQVGSAVQPAGSDAEGFGIKQQRPVGPQAEPARVALPALVRQKSAQVRHAGARPVGDARAVDATATAQSLQRLLQWTPTASGGMKAAVSFSSQDAQGLRLGLQVRQMPADAVVRVYRQDRPALVYEITGQAILQIIERNAAAGDASDNGRTWWTPDSGASEATLEIELPAGVPATALDVAVPALAHLFENMSLPPEGALAAKAVGDAIACNLDSTCFDEYAAQRDAVARMLFVDNGKAYVCTGTLLNDRDATRTPYFLSANHCIASQTVASTLQTDWFFRSQACNSGTLSPQSTARTGGATLLVASADTDTALLRLNEAPPAGAVFAAWDASPQAEATSVVGIHHPRGDLQKISTGSIMGTLACTNDTDGSMLCDSSTDASAGYYDVGFDRGTVEDGSSGSAIFREGRVIGTLYGFAASAQCSVNDVRVYGRFDLAYQKGLKQWLSPPVGIPPAWRHAAHRFLPRPGGVHVHADFSVRPGFPDGSANSTRSEWMVSRQRS
ncbi:Trypsin-like peptidase domain-containing protein [Paracidovorax valerianellae]|uniref:Trypsin-like peptidase domain-containing protein n=1 Tax=Paracidovorax valerianellae TaxID=187868 RepID=A0A1G6QAU0_9BURK|nr:serine protease [Paracidovorax valerianellae]SDC89413.1 Trypsin-like peptidase domain-containing protein [Paracidovorax valerianellae]